MGVAKSIIALSPTRASSLITHFDLRLIVVLPETIDDSVT